MNCARIIFGTLLFLGLCGSAVAAGHAEAEKAFYDWWDIARFGGGAGIEETVNIPAFSGLRSMGRPAVEYVEGRIEEDRMSPDLILAAVKILKGEADWKPTKDPTVPENLIEKRGMAVPSSAPVAGLGSWGVEGNKSFLRPSAHPRLSRQHSVGIFFEGTGERWVEIGTKLRLKRGKYFVFTCDFSQGMRTKMWNVEMTVEWMDADQRTLGKDSLAVDTQSIARGRSWFTGVLPSHRPQLASFAVLKLRFSIDGKKENSPASLYADRFMFVEDF